MTSVLDPEAFQNRPIGFAPAETDLPGLTGEIEDGGGGAVLGPENNVLSEEIQRCARLCGPGVEAVAHDDGIAG